MKKKLLSALLAIVMVFSLTIPAMAESAFSDMPQDYSTAALEAAAANGLLKGTDGKILPNDMLTRAQMAAIMVRAFGAAKSADISAFADADKDAWYYAELSKAVYMGILKGDGKAMNPNAYITRQEAFLVLSRAFNLKATNSAGLDKFADKASVASWAAEGVSAMVEAGYVKGDEKGNINPTAGISRKDFAVTMDRMIKTYISKAGTVTELKEGSVMINVPGVVLKDVTVKGNLIIGDGVGDGNVTLENVKVEGATVVRGGGVNSFIVRGNSSLGKIIVTKVDGNVRVAVEGGAKVEIVEINDGKDDVIVEGSIAKLEVAASDVPVVVQNAKIGEVTISAPNADVTVAATAKVETVTVEKTAAKTELVVSGTVTNVTANADNTVVSGNGTVTNVKVESGSGTAVTTPGTKVEAGKDASNVTAGDKPVTPETPVEVPKEEVPPYIPPVDTNIYVNTVEELNAALASAKDNDVICFNAGNIEIEKTIKIDKPVTIKGAANYGTKFTVSGDKTAFHISAAATLDGIFVEKTDKTNSHLVSITANDATVKNSKFIGKYVLGDSEVTRAIVPNAGITGYTIANNHIEALRQPAYLEGAGSVTDNFVKGTRGWVVCVNHAVTFTGNRFEGNAVDIAIIPNGQSTSENYTDVEAISKANNNAFVENQLINVKVVNDETALTTALAAGGTVVLGSDITVSDSWLPVGTQGSPFTGTLDGNSCSILGLKTSLLSYTSGAIIKNLDLKNVNISANNASALVYCATNGTFENITLSGEINGTNQAGGIVWCALANNGIATFKNCYNAANITISNTDNSTKTAGGLAAQMESATESTTAESPSFVFEDCRNTGAITLNEYGQSYTWAGQLFGNTSFDNSHSGPFYAVKITNCRGSGTITVTGEPLGTYAFRSGETDCISGDSVKVPVLGLGRIHANVYLFGDKEIISGQTGVSSSAT